MIQFAHYFNKNIKQRFDKNAFWPKEIDLTDYFIIGLAL